MQGCTAAIRTADKKTKQRLCSTCNRLPDEVVVWPSSEALTERCLQTGGRMGLGEIEDNGWRMTAI